MSTALERYENPSDSIELAGKAWPIAEKIARTEFVPDALRGKPEAVLACIMTGHELGIGPMQSLAKIHVIKGKPAMAAELMRAVILAHGHEFWLEESSNTRVTVGGKRSDSTRETRITWTMDDAKQAGLQGRDGWKNYPRAMLLARATAELARAVFPDVLAGISYTVEEIADGDVVDPVDLLAAGDATDTPPGGEPKKATATAKKAATRKAAAPKAAPARGDVPPLPGEDDDVTPPDPGDVEAQHEARPLPGPAAIAVALKAKGIEDRDAKLRIVECVLGRDTGSLDTTKNLDDEQTALVLRSIANLTPADLEEIVHDAIQDADVVDDGTRSPDPEPPRTDDTTSDVDTWNEDAWRTFLKDRGVKVTELIREAQRLAKEDSEAGPASLEQIVGSSASLKALLRGFVEDLAAQRSPS